MIAFPSVTPIRICFVCDEYPPALHGGIGSLVQTLARALVAEGHEARVIGVQKPDCTAPSYEEDHGVRVWRYRASNWKYTWPLARYRVLQTVKKWSRNKDVNVIEVVDFAGPAAMWPKLPVPVIKRLHGSATFFSAELERKLRKQDYWIERASLRRADYVCSISQYAASRTREAFGVPSLPIEVLHDFIDTKYDHSLARSKNSVVYSGTLTEKKGVIELIQAWRTVNAANPDARLHIYGKDSRAEDGSSMKQLLISMLDPSLRETIKFHGHIPREELFAALSRARVGVFPSHSETFGLGPVESMAAACPTIYGRCGCASEIIRDGVDGLLVEPGQPEQLADAILRLLTDSRLAERLGKAGRTRVDQQFSAETMIRRNEEFYRSCIDEFSNRNGHS